MSQPKFQPLSGSPAGVQLPPPFDFQGVTMRVFPVRANLSQLRRFCDAFLNIVPPEVGEFRPALPYIYIMVLNYGRMSIEAANMGWIAQHELTFSIALEWHRKVGDKMVFQDWAYVSPFIYVDNDMSMTTGRRVYGWPKSMSWLERSLSSWTSQPTGPSSLLTLSTMVFPKAYAGAWQEPRTLLDVVHNPGLMEPQIPPRTEDWLSVVTSLPNAMASSFELMRDYASIVNGFVMGRGQGTREIVQAAGRLIGDMNPLSPNIAFNTINLKQFRDSEIPEAACYQALVNAPMVTTSFNSAGMLGLSNMLAGDFSGGYRLHLHRYASHPIIETLGIDVDEEWTVGDFSVSSLKPIFPFWMDIDMRYNLGQTLAWRTRGSHWMSDYGLLPARPRPEPALPEPTPAPEPESRPAAARMPLMFSDMASDARPAEATGALSSVGAGASSAGASTVVPLHDRAATDPLSYHRYNSALGAATQQLAGPFEFPNATVRVLPLLAKREVLEAFCSEHLDTNQVTARPYGSYVYLLITNVEEAISKSGNIGGWGFRQVSFALPVKIYRRETRELVKVSMVLPYVFIDNSMAANTFSEVLGLETEEAKVTSPPNAWLGESGPAEATKRQVLEVVARVFPVLDQGQEAVERKVVEAFYGDVLPYNDDVRWRFVAEGWGRTLLDEYRAKTATAGNHPEQLEAGLALALELLANREPLSIVTLKQFRSAERPDEACYQSIVDIPQTIDEIYDLREIEHLMHVKVRNYPSLPIVDTLGLIPKWVSTEDCDQVYNLQPVRPFWMKVSMSQGLGRKLAERAGTMHWTMSGSLDRDPPYLARDEQPRVGRDLINRIALRTDLTYYWKEVREEDEGDREQKGLMAETMNVLGRLVDLLHRGNEGGTFVLALEIADAVAEIGDVSEEGTEELVAKLTTLVASLKEQGNEKMRLLATEIERLLPQLRGESGENARGAIALLVNLTGAVREETKAQMGAMRQDLESVLQRITQGYESNQLALERFRAMLAKEPHEDAGRVAAMIDATLERIEKLLAGSKRAVGYLDSHDGDWRNAGWAEVDALLRELARDETTPEVRKLAEKLYQPPQRLRTVVNNWLGEQGERLTRAQAKRAIERIEPQLIIESILSREWEHWGRPRWYRNREQKPDFAVSRQSIGFKLWRDEWFPEDESFSEEWYGRHGDVQGSRTTGMRSLTALPFSSSPEDD